MDIKNIVPVEWSNQRVLTSVQLAEFYECSPKQIMQNFSNNRDRFIAGKHFIKLEGESLKAFRVYIDNIEVDGLSVEVDIPAHTRHFYLWTERGAARHAKMLSTDVAWEVYEELEDNYFNPPVVVVPAVETAPAPVVELPEYRIYLFLLSDGTVKIGFSKRFCARIGEVKREINRRRKADGKEKLTFKDVYFTPKMTYEDARLVEHCFKEIYSDEHIEDEIFAVAFKKARAKVKYLVKLSVATLSNQSVNLIADKQD